MSYQKIRICRYLWLFLFPCHAYASFIESTMGTAIVNDATAAYYNPAALTLLKNSQSIALGSIAQSQSHFSGTVTQTATDFTQEGSSESTTHYYLPSLYFGMPASEKITVGLAIVSNFFNKDLGDDSILRYAQSNNSINDMDIVPAIAFKINDHFSIGASINVSRAHFLLEPTTGFPSLTIPDSQSRNESDGTAVGGDVGLLIKRSPSSLIGLNYRSAVTYRLSGTSTTQSDPEFSSNDYHFDFWTPARIVLSIGQFITPSLGFIGTIQHIQWSIFNEINIHGIATQIGSQSVIVDATVPYHLHNTWLLTLGSQYRINPKCIIRAAGNYNQSPGNSHYQITNGDSIILGASMGYEIYKNILIDGSYAHGFMKDENIHITSGRNSINGVNSGFRDAVSLKLTFNLA